MRTIWPLLLLIACTPPLYNSNGEPVTAADVPDEPAPGGTSPLSPPVTTEVPGTTPTEPGCEQPVCADWNVVLSCAETAAGTTFTETTCAQGQGCVQGACVAGECSDACELGEDDCELYDVATDDWVSIDDAGLHDRARAFEGWLRHDTESEFHGTTVSVQYTASDLRTVEDLYVGDAALHTGVTMAAEAWRLEATGSAVARDHVRDYVELFHLLYNVSGDPAMLANIAVPAGDSAIRNWTDWDCSDRDRHCNVTYDGAQWDYIGEPSRDMYVGPLLGLLVAYDALGDADADMKQVIREDIVATAMELKRLRTISVVFEVDGFEFPPMSLDTRFFIPETADQDNGHVMVSIDTSDLDNSGEIQGGQEFYPNPSVLFRNAPLLGWIPDIPRSSSAMMVGAWLSSAIHVTEGVAGWEAEHDELVDFYLYNNDEWGNSEDLLDMSASWLNLRDCGERYFGYNLAMIPLYVWLRTETDPGRNQALFDQALSGRLWNDVDTHKNPFFSYFYAEVAPGGAPSVAADANTQIGLFPAPPRVRSGADLTQSPNYANTESGCDDVYDLSDAIDVDDRGPTYFQWHDSPWELVDDRDTSQTYPGHDYLVAYWQGRAGGHLTDERPSRCLRERP